MSSNGAPSTSGSRVNLHPAPAAGIEPEQGRPAWNTDHCAGVLRGGPEPDLEGWVVLARPREQPFDDGRLFVAASFAVVREPRLTIPCSSSPTDLCSAGRLGFADQSRDKRLMLAAVLDVLTDLDGEDVGGLHCWFRNSTIARSSAGIRSATKIGRRRPAAKSVPTRSQKPSRSASEPSASASTSVGSVSLHAAFETRLDRFQPPVRQRVGRVVEHLSDDFSADPGVGASLYLHERRNPVVVKEEVVDAPAVRSILLGGDAELA